MTDAKKLLAKAIIMGIMRGPVDGCDSQRNKTILDALVDVVFKPVEGLKLEDVVHEDLRKMVSALVMFCFYGWAVCQGVFEKTEKFPLVLDQVACRNLDVHL